KNTVWDPEQTKNLIPYPTNASGIWVATTIESHPVGAHPQIVWDPVRGNLHVYYHGMPIPRAPALRQAPKKPGQPWQVTNLPVAADHSAKFSLTIDSEGVRHLVWVSPMREFWHMVDVGIRDPSHPWISRDPIPLPTPSSAPDFTASVAEEEG